jgi:hypothetical protein
MRGACGAIGVCPPPGSWDGQRLSPCLPRPRTCPAGRADTAGVRPRPPSTSLRCRSCRQRATASIPSRRRPGSPRVFVVFDKPQSCFKNEVATISCQKPSPGCVRRAQSRGRRRTANRSCRARYGTGRCQVPPRGNGADRVGEMGMSGELAAHARALEPDEDDQDGSAPLTRSNGATWRDDAAEATERRIYGRRSAAFGGERGERGEPLGRPQVSRGCPRSSSLWVRGRRHSRRAAL